MLVCRSSDELSHHGIIGQKWGIRRYQNRDGTLTAAGKKRAAKALSEYESLTGSKHKRLRDYSSEELQERTARLKVEKDYFDAQKNATDSRKNSILSKRDFDSRTKSEKKKLTELSDEELARKIERLKLEKSYNELDEEISNARMSREIKRKELEKKYDEAMAPEKSLGRKAIEYMGKEVLIPVAKDVGKQYLSKFLKDKLGLSADDAEKTFGISKDDFEKAKREATYYENLSKIKTNKSKLESDDSSDGTNNKGKKSGDDNKSSNNGGGKKPPNNGGGNDGKKPPNNGGGASKTKSTTEKEKVYTGTVVGDGPKKSSSDSSHKDPLKGKTVIDVEWREVNSERTKTGSSTASALLSGSFGKSLLSGSSSGQRLLPGSSSSSKSTGTSTSSNTIDPRVAKGVKDVDDYTEELLRRLRNG